MSAAGGAKPAPGFAPPRQPASFSNRSAPTDAYAAGAYVTSARNGGGTLPWPGTSFAAPMMAACPVALKQAAAAAGPFERMDAMRPSPTRVTDVVGGRQYPFLDCIDADRLVDPAVFGPFEARGPDPLLPPETPGQAAGFVDADEARARFRRIPARLAPDHPGVGQGGPRQ